LLRLQKREKRLKRDQNSFRVHIDAKKSLHMASGEETGDGPHREPST